MFEGIIVITARHTKTFNPYVLSHTYAPGVKSSSLFDIANVWNQLMNLAAFTVGHVSKGLGESVKFDYILDA